ncbi:hypothetical protein [Streptococcus chenjunshii]|uniref:hypothetical protein n=1 Tax=Streptococcus chenjunshii TaxID=2173853 RepID=UPI0013C2FACE|nr:hypothetical protein [Streptococcus chenjunshii]
MRGEIFYSLENSRGIDLVGEDVVQKNSVNPNIFIMGEAGEGKGFFIPSLRLNQV